MRLTSSTVFHCSSVMSTRVASRWSPAFDTRMSIVPQAAIISWNIDRTSASRATSARMAMASTPPAWSSADQALGVLGAAHVVDDDVRAGGGERAGDALADPGVGPGHERLLTLERLVSRHVGRSSSASS